MKNTPHQTCTEYRTTKTDSDSMHFWSIHVYHQFPVTMINNPEQENSKRNKLYVSGKNNVCYKYGQQTNVL